MPRPFLPAAKLPLVCGLALLAAGCGKMKDPDAIDQKPDTAANFNHPFDAFGLSPGWSLKVRGTMLTLSRDTDPTVAATAPGATITPHTASWTGTLADGRQMTVRLFQSDCEQAGKTYAFAAEVDMPGANPLVGCATAGR